MVVTIRLRGHIRVEKERPVLMMEGEVGFGAQHLKSVIEVCSSDVPVGSHGIRYELCNYSMPCRSGNSFQGHDK